MHVSDKLFLSTFPASLGLIIHFRQITFTFAYVSGWQLLYFIKETYWNMAKNIWMFCKLLQFKVMLSLIIIIFHFNGNWPSLSFDKIVNKLTFCSITLQKPLLPYFIWALWNHHSTIRPQTSSRILEQTGIYIHCSQGETNDYEKNTLTLTNWILNSNE